MQTLKGEGVDGGTPYWAQDPPPQLPSPYIRAGCPEQTRERESWGSPFPSHSQIISCSGGVGLRNGGPRPPDQEFEQKGETQLQRKKVPGEWGSQGVTRGYEGCSEVGVHKEMWVHYFS